MDTGTNLATQLVSLFAIGVKTILPQLATQHGMVGYRFVQHHAVDWTALPLIAVQQLSPAPALQHGGQLPAQIHAVGYAHVHAVTTKRRMQMASITGQKNAAVSVAVAQKTTGYPLVSREHFVGQIYACRLSDQCGCIARSKFPALRHAGRHEKPFVAPVHGADQAGCFAVDLPVHDGRAMFVRFIQAGRAKYDVVVA